MTKINYQEELGKIIDTRKLVEVRFQSTPGEFKVAYILNIHKKFITLLEIDPKNSFDGVCMYRSEDVVSLKLDSGYLKKIEKNILKSTMYERALKDIESIQEFSFDGVVSLFEGTNEILDFACKNGNSVAGKVISNDADIVVIDGIDEDDLTHLSRCFLRFDAITRIGIDIPYVQDIIHPTISKNWLGRRMKKLHGALMIRRGYSKF